MRKIYCDKCGEELAFRNRQKLVFSDYLERTNEYDVCEACRNEMEAAIQKH